MECGLCFVVTNESSEILGKLLEWAQLILKHIHVTSNTPLLVCQNCFTHLGEVQEFCEFIERRQLAFQTGFKPKEALQTINSVAELTSPEIKIEFEEEIMSEEALAAIITPEILDEDKRTLEFQENIVTEKVSTVQIDHENIKIEFVSESEGNIFEEVSKCKGTTTIEQNLHIFSTTPDNYTRNKNKCKYCDQFFPCERDLSRHIREEHIARHHKKEFEDAINDINDRTCIICNKIYDTVTVLRFHIYHMHRNAEPHACKECNSKFKFHDSLRRHIIQTHSKPGPIRYNVKHQCSICNIRFKTLNAQKNHMKSFHTGKSPFACDKCPLKFSLGTSLRLHKKECSGNVLKLKSKQIDQIDFTTENDNLTNQANAFEELHVKMSLREQITSTADIEGNNTEVFNQIIEGNIKTEKDTNFNENTSSDLNTDPMNSITNSELEIHATKLNDLIVLKAKSDTGMFYENSLEGSLLLEYFKDEKTINSGDLFCEVCNKNFKSICGLQRHLFKKHSNKDRFYCKKCSSTFQSMNYFIEHGCVQRKYGKLKKKFNPDTFCVICSKSYKNSRGLAEHVYYKHKFEKPHACNRCQQAFRFHHKLRKHLSEAHPKSAEDDTEDRTCILCNITFKNIPFLRKHIYNRHKKQKPFTCQNCGNSYTMNVALKRHLRKCEISMTEKELKKNTRRCCNC